MCVLLVEFSALRHAEEFPQGFANVVTVESKGAVDDNGVVYRRGLDPVALNPTGHKTQRDVVHNEAVTVTTVPFNPMPEDCCAKLGVDCIAVPGELEGCI